MAYFLFHKLEVSEGSLYRIAENDFDLNNLNIIKSDYKTIEVNQEDFLNVKLGSKYAKTYNNNNIIYEDLSVSFANKNSLEAYIKLFIRSINNYLKNNSNSQSFTKWNDYKNQLSNLNIDSISYPLNTSLEQYFKDQNQTSLSPLQLP